MSDTGVDFDTLDRVVNVICKPTPTLTVKHIVTLTRIVEYPDSYKANRTVQKKLPYASVWEAPKTAKFEPMKGLYLNQSSFIQLSGVTQITENDGNTTKKTIKCDIKPNNFIPFLAMLDNGYSWLAGTAYRNTFILDENERPLKIRDPFQKENCPLTQTTYISIRPSIIRDAANVRYEGILMQTAEGELTNFTAVEFASFKEQMHSLLPNLYTASTALVNQAILYSIYSKQKETGRI